MDPHDRERLVQEHLEAIRRLQGEPALDDHAMSPQGGPARAGMREYTWPPDQYYLLWHIVVGLMLGLIGAAVSLTFNVVGAPLAGEHPLQLIRVYLTFPMGAAALTATDGAVLTVGCILYLVTGGLYGIVFHLVMSWFLPNASAWRRFLVGTMLGLALWIINFYAILSWLQPVLLGDNWIVREVPMAVAAATHVLFAWTMLLIEFWGRFDPRSHRA